MLWMFPWNIRTVHLSVNDYHFKPRMGHTVRRHRLSARKVIASFISVPCPASRFKFIVVDSAKGVKPLSIRQREELLCPCFSSTHVVLSTTSHPGLSQPRDNYTHTGSE